MGSTRWLSAGLSPIPDDSEQDQGRAAARLTCQDLLTPPRMRPAISNHAFIDYGDETIGHR
jgi:hypothetical protein